jgi:hypothetical protein
MSKHFRSVPDYYEQVPYDAPGLHLKTVEDDGTFKPQRGKTGNNQTKKKCLFCSLETWTQGQRNKKGYQYLEPIHNELEFYVQCE